MSAESSSPRRKALGLEAAVAAVIEAGARAAARGWTPATAGNFSAAIDEGAIAMTRTGRDKGALTPDDVAALDLESPDYTGLSAEAPLHVALYRSEPTCAAVWHAHSPAAVLASRLGEDAGAIRLQGWELQKALAGVTSHEQDVEVAVLPNDQDTVRLGEEATARLKTSRLGATLAPGYLLAGHGLYAWGASPADAWRHLEALETLLDHELALRRFRL